MSIPIAKDIRLLKAAFCEFNSIQRDRKKKSRIDDQLVTVHPSQLLVEEDDDFKH